jgi:DNA polymerase III subunit chi
MNAEIWFYHLERQSADEALSLLLEKCLERNWRALVRLDSYEEIERLDAHLWVYRPESFLPHGASTGTDAARLPVLLTADPENRNNAQVQFVLGACDVENAEAFERVVVIFNGAEPEELAAARETWKRLKGQGAEVSYWRQNERGQWAKTA